jgi:hypothetical protein
MGADVPSRPEAARRVAEADAAIQRELAALMERIMPLTQCCAETTASFDVLRGRWQDDAGRLHAALGDIAAAVGGSR